MVMVRCGALLTGAGSGAACAVGATEPGVCVTTAVAAGEGVAAAF